MNPKDESGVIVSWLVKVGLVLLVIGVVGFDVGSIIVNNWTLSTAAEDVAVSVSVSADERGSTSMADSQIYDLAVEVVEGEEEGVEGAKVLRKGTLIDDEGVVHVRLRRRAETLITHLIGPLKDRTIAVLDGQAGTN